MPDSSEKSKMMEGTISTLAGQINEAENPARIQALTETLIKLVNKSLGQTENEPTEMAAGVSMMQGSDKLKIMQSTLEGLSRDLEAAKKSEKVKVASRLSSLVNSLSEKITEERAKVRGGQREEARAST
jgi:hypothetical protein